MVGVTERGARPGRFNERLPGLRLFILIAVSLVAGCTTLPETGKRRAEALDWTSLPPRNCRAEMPARLTASALELAGLDLENLAIDDSDLGSSRYASLGVLDDPFVVPWLKTVRERPANLGCFEGEVVYPLDAYLDVAHTVAHLIRHAARLLGHFPDPRRPALAADLPGGFDEALAILCAQSTEISNGCLAGSGELPDILAAELAPILWAMVDVIETVRHWHASDPRISASWWHINGGNLLRPGAGVSRPNLQNPAIKAGLLGNGHLPQLYDVASRLAFAIENADFSAFVGANGVSYDRKTPFGWIRVRDADDDVYPLRPTSELLLLDLGGNDLHLDAVASNAIDTPVSIVIDLDGEDRYQYPGFEEGGDPSLLPVDSEGRYAGKEAGPFTLSNISRQGAARYGVAMLFDLGRDNDRYRSLSASQGYAHLGVGVLFDDGGDDRYLAEALSQGAGQFGIGLLIDAGTGNDQHLSHTRSQGFGYAAGVGILLQDGGDDSYVCVREGIDGLAPLYPSAQMGHEGSNSACQGAGFGRRGPTRGDHLSGGIGILRDISGDDSYEAGVFAQGVGFWQGTGVLSDAVGADQYDAYYYAQGAAAHYAIGLLSDAGPGPDRFNLRVVPRYVQLGSGHDFSVGVLINEAGDDVYQFAGLAVGASNCNGIGLFVDNGGDDSYQARSDYGSGMGNVSSECLSSRSQARSIGVMIDAGGRDSYHYPKSRFPVPTDKGRWGHRRNGLPTEYGVGMDGEGETGIHSGG